MNSSLRWFGLFVVGLVFQLPTSGQAQATPKKPADLVGTWRYVFPDASDTEFASLHRTITFRSDSTSLETLTRRSRADTLSCTNKDQWQLAGDTLVSWSWWQDRRKVTPNKAKIYMRGDTTKLWIDKGWQHAVLQDQQLVISGYGADVIFTRLASPVGPARDYLAPEPIEPATGKLADLVGTWERLPKPERDAGLVRGTFTIRPDLTYVNIAIWKDGKDIFSCTGKGVLGKENELSVSGDTLSFSSPGPRNLVQYVTRYIVQGQQLFVFPTVAMRNGRPVDSTAAVTAVPENVYKRAAKQP